jgi:hypothetical protein
MGAVRVWGKPLTYEPRDTPSLHWVCSDLWQSLRRRPEGNGGSLEIRRALEVKT